MLCINMKVLWSEGKYYEMFTRFIWLNVHIRLSAKTIILHTTHYTLTRTRIYTYMHAHANSKQPQWCWTLVICIHSGAVPEWKTYTHTHVQMQAYKHLKWNDHMKMQWIFNEIFFLHEFYIGLHTHTRAHLSALLAAFVCVRSSCGIQVPQQWH